MPSLTAAPELSDYVAGLKQQSRKVITLALRQLLRFVREYPREPLLGAVREDARLSARRWSTWLNHAVGDMWRAEG
jgi:hypothetical protein